MKTRTSPRRVVFVAAALVALLGTFVAADAQPAEAASFRATVIKAPGVSFVNVRAEANTTSRVLRTIASGNAVGLQCYVTGTAVRGPYGVSSIWYRIDGGGFVTDSYLETGSNSAVTAHCNAPSQSVKITNALNWARAQATNKSMNYNGLCERFVENAYGTSGRYASAIANYNAQLAAGRINRSTTNIPAGALVFSSNRALDLGYGHVQISLGNGTFVSGGVSTRVGNGATVQILRGLPSGFLGWSMPPTSWPGR